ncbi:MAG: hypothetical protein PF517_19185 [Salinivirgaceae bacterium]|jgi:hypothetical protein|nr:hypothetical protein [Salinivirgaceae bacterium]
MTNQSLINKKIFITALSTLFSGYLLMAVVPIEFVIMTLSPIVILLGFALVVVSIIKPSKAAC